MSRMAMLGWGALCGPLFISLVVMVLLWRHIRWDREGRRK